MPDPSTLSFQPMTIGLPLNLFSAPVQPNDALGSNENGTTVAESEASNQCETLPCHVSPMAGSASVLIGIDMGATLEDV